jgi:hypothetical protein
VNRATVTVRPPAAFGARPRTQAKVCVREKNASGIFLRRPAPHARRSAPRAAESQWVGRSATTNFTSDRSIGLNWYAYANGNPIGRVDPTGLATLVLWGTNYSHPEDPDYFKNHATAWSNSSGIKDAVVMPGGSTADWNAAIGSVGIVDAIVYIGHSGALSGPTKLREGVDVNHVSQPNFAPNASVTLYGCSTGSVSPGDTSNSAQTYANRFGVPTHGSTTGVSFGLPVPLTNIDLNPGYVRQSGTISPATMKTYSPRK